MDQPTPPLSSNPQSSGTSALAIWSLVLGILSLTCFSIFAAIPGVICGHKALGGIKRSAGALGGEGLAVAGLVTGYLGIALAVMVVPLMLAIAIPNFVKAKQIAQKNACVNHLKEIDNAKNQWALEKGKKSTDVPTWNDVIPYLKDGQMPTCPAGGTYTLHSAQEQPTCSIAGHQLD